MNMSPSDEQITARRADIDAKQNLVADVLAEMNCEAVVLLMPAHVSWFTSGLTVHGLIADSERPGVYTVTLTVRDESGLPTGAHSDRVAAVVREAPIADAGPPVMACTNQTVRLDGSRSAGSFTSAPTRSTARSRSGPPVRTIRSSPGRRTRRPRPAPI